MIRVSLNIVILCLLGLVFIGCQKNDGRPLTIPCSISVVHGDTPIEGVQVTLYPQKMVSPANYTISADTNSDGLAQLNCFYATNVLNGVPQGEYKVTCNKEIPLEYTKTPEELENMPPPKRDQYLKELKRKRDAKAKIVPGPLTREKDSPLTVTISPESANKEVLKINLKDYAP